MFWIQDAYAKVWEIKNNEKYDDLKISTSEKDTREEGKYKNSNWFARAIGHAHEQIKAGEIKEKDRVKIAKGKVTNEPYTDDEGNKKSWLRVVIMEFDTGDRDDRPAKPAKPEKSKGKSAKAKPVDTGDDVISDGDLPF